MIAPIARFDTGQSHLVAAFQARHLKGGLKARAGWRWAGYLHGILIFKRREGETPPRSPTQKLCTVASGIIGGAGQEFCRTNRPARVLAPSHQYITWRKFYQPSKLFPLKRVSAETHRQPSCFHP